MDYNAYYQKCLKTYSSADAVRFSSFFNYFMDNYEKDYVTLSEKLTIVSLFYRGTKSLGKTSFYKDKRFIFDLYVWLYSYSMVSDEALDYIKNITLTDIVSDDKILFSYFKSLSSLYGFIDNVASVCGNGNIIPDVYNIKSVVALAWHGFKINDMVSLKKIDIVRETKTVKLNERYVTLDDESFDAINMFISLDSQHMFPSGRLRNFLDSEFVFRNAKNATPDENTIWNIIKHFNNVSIKFGRTLSIYDLGNNGLFCKLLSENIDNADVGKRITSILECDRSVSYGIKHLYEKWKEVYYPSAGA